MKGKSDEDTRFPHTGLPVAQVQVLEGRKGTVVERLLSALLGTSAIAYVVLRPSSYLVDREEQDLDIALREHQLSHYGICPKCGTPIDRDFIVCPICNTQVRNVCPTCHRPLNADWKVCPYCRTRIQ